MATPVPADHLAAYDHPTIELVNRLDSRVSGHPVFRIEGDVPFPRQDVAVLRPPRSKKPHVTGSTSGPGTA